MRKTLLSYSVNFLGALSFPVGINDNNCKFWLVFSDRNASQTPSEEHFSFQADTVVQPAAPRRKSFMDFFKRKTSRRGRHDNLSRVNSTPVCDNNTDVWMFHLIYSHHISYSMFLCSVGTQLYQNIAPVISTKCHSVVLMRVYLFTHIACNLAPSIS